MKSNKQLIDELTSKFNLTNVQAKPACGIKARNLKNTNGKGKFLQNLLSVHRRSQQHEECSDLSENGLENNDRKLSNESAQFTPPPSPCYFPHGQGGADNSEYDVPWESKFNQQAFLDNLGDKLNTIMAGGLTTFSNDAPLDNKCLLSCKSIGSQSSTDDSGIYEPPWDSNSHAFLQKLSNSIVRPASNHQKCAPNDARDKMNDDPQKLDNSPSFFDICNGKTIGCGLPIITTADSCCSCSSLEKSPWANNINVNNNSCMVQDDSNKSDSSRSSSTKSSKSNIIQNNLILNEQHYNPDNSFNPPAKSTDCAYNDGQEVGFRRDLLVQKLCDDVRLVEESKERNESLTSANTKGTVINVPLIRRFSSAAVDTRTNARKQVAQHLDLQEEVYDVPWEFSCKQPGFQRDTKTRAHSQPSPSSRSISRRNGDHKCGKSSGQCKKHTYSIDDRPLDGFALKSSLESEDWYHGNINRQEAESRLENSTDGSFLVRCCEMSEDLYQPEYALSLK